ncbi:MAG: VOC family protein [Verrucomicrobiota bacterium JB025]|nr:VOC family protein [Verrucomicrobiota bacterium JB025]
MSESNHPNVKPGTFGWNELMSSNPEAAKKFYGAVFGWVADTANVAPGVDYTMFKKDDVPVAGLLEIKPEMGPVPPNWLAYVNSDDVAADVAKVRAAGGTVLQDVLEIPNAGTMAVIQDTEGAVFALWKCAENSKCG